MKKSFKKIIAAALAAMMVIPAGAVAAGAEEAKDYVIENPYSEVIWTGDDAWTAYKGNLHTHSYVSDANVDLRDMVMEYYNQGFDFLAFTEHGVTGKPWNERQTEIPLYIYQRVIGNIVHTLTDEEYEAITNGTYPVDGVARGTGMLYVPGGNELNALTATKDHVNAIFLPEHAGDNYLGYENDYEGAVRLADHYGAVSFINHPGDWLFSRDNRAAVYDQEKIDYISDILLRYDSCLGMEVFNENNSMTPYDRDLWDNILMECLPYGKQVIGFSNGDTHYLSDVDSSFSVFMMEDCTVDNIRKTMGNGAFFMVTRKLRADPEKYGPETDMDAKNQNLAYPMFTDIQVEGHTLTVEVVNANNIEWVANANVIERYDIEETEEGKRYTIDLDEIEGSEDFLYVRCQLIGTGGITLTQAFAIDDATEKPEYVRDNSARAILARIIRQILGLRVFAIAKVLMHKAGC